VIVLVKPGNSLMITSRQPGTSTPRQEQPGLTLRARDLSNNQTVSGDSEVKTARFAGGHQDLLAGGREDGNGGSYRERAGCLYGPLWVCCRFRACDSFSAWAGGRAQIVRFRVLRSGRRPAHTGKGRQRRKRHAVAGPQHRDRQQGTIGSAFSSVLGWL